MAQVAFVPQEIAGWRHKPDVRTFTRETIFDYIDGAGEVYRLYDFRGVSVFEFEKIGAEPIIVEVFDMGSAGDAYGIFTFYHEGEEVAVGREAYLKAGLLCFWQDKYFVCLCTTPEGDATGGALRTLARAIAANMPNEGAPPPWLRHFPSSGRRPQSVRYFHNQASLNYHYFLSEKNVLNLSDHTKCALAWYQASGRNFIQLWVQYPDSAAALAARDSLARAYVAAGGIEGVIPIGERRWAAFSIRGRFLAAAFDLPSKPLADSVWQASKSLLDEVDK